MDTSFIFDKTTPPNPQKIADLMGEVSPFWDEICQFLKKEIGEITYEWKFYSKKWGWTMKALLKKRNLFFFKPYESSFAITFVFGDKAVEAVNRGDLPESIKEELNNARKYMEGRGLRVEVSGEKDVENIKKLIMIKINN